MDIDLKQLRELMRSLKQFEIAEIEIEKNGERIYLRRGADAPSGMVSPVALAPAALPPGALVSGASVPPPPPASAAAPASNAADPNVVSITSPFVGTFYRSPSPESPAFVEVGAEIRAGQVLCIVEAMKLMNEIESEIAGTVLEVLVENGKPVEYGDALFRVRKH